MIDDEIGAPSGRNRGYGRENFLRDMSAAPAEWFFHDAFDSFTGFFLASEALGFVATVETPDVFLVDLMFGEERTLGLEIISGIQDRFPRARIALLTTHVAADVVTGDDGPFKLGDWVAAHGIKLINKEAIFQSGELWRAIDALMRARRRGGGASKRDA